MFWSKIFHLLASYFAMDGNNRHVYDTVGNPTYEMVENVSYSAMKPDHRSNTIEGERKSVDKKSGTGGEQANSSKVAVVLAVATCCSALLALCSLGVAAYAVVVQQSQVDNMASAGTQELPLRQLHQDVNITQLQLSIMADKITELTDMITEINNISRGPPGEIWDIKKGTCTYFVTLLYCSLLKLVAIKF